MDFTYINLLPEDVKELIAYIGQENIFKLVFGDVSFSKKYKSPFREDTNPGCFFKVTGVDKLQFIDYGDPNRTYYGCMDAVQAKYNLDFMGAINFIREHFRTADNLAYGEYKVESENTEVRPEKIIKPILYSERMWNLKDKEYWTEFGITKQQLIDDEIHPIDLFSIMSNSGMLYSKRPFSVAYAYLFPEGRVKIYTPLAINKLEKWFTNCLTSDVGNINNLDPKGDLLVITKSYKDSRVLRNLGYKNTIWTQSETQLPPIEILLDLIKRFKKVVIFFDNDQEGVKSAKKLEELLNSLIEGKSSSIVIPIKSSTKDISDFYKKFGKEKTIKFLNNKIK